MTGALKYKTSTNKILHIVSDAKETCLKLVRFKLSQDEDTRSLTLRTLSIGWSLRVA